MTKRLLAGGLWFFAVTYAWAFVAEVAGLTAAAGPVIGLMVAAFVAVDPGHHIWTTRPARVTMATTAGVKAVTNPA